MIPLTIIIVLFIFGFSIWFFSEGATLKRQITRRQNQALRRKILEKAKLIVAILSGNRLYADNILTVSRQSTFSETLSDTCSIDIVRVSFFSTGKLLYEWYECRRHSGTSSTETREVRTYIPGEWEKHLETLYRKALQTEKVQQRQQNLLEKEQSKKKFGL